MDRSWASTGLRVAVTGGEGFLGREIIAALRAGGAQTLVLPDDVRNPISIDGPIDVLCHFAGMVGSFFSRDPGDGIRVNLIGTFNALELCRRLRARLVFASTCAIYKPYRGAVKETDPAGPVESYAVSKYCADLLCQTYAAHFNLPVTILRIFNPYGAGQSEGFLIPYLCRTIRNGEVLRLKHPDSVRDFIHVRDLAEAVRRSCVSSDSLAIMNIGSGVPLRVIDVAGMISRLTGIGLQWDQVPDSVDEYGGMWADISEAQAKLRWRPEISIESGLQLMLRSG